jgi:hypothetical protein
MIPLLVFVLAGLAASYGGSALIFWAFTRYRARRWP